MLAAGTALFSFTSTSWLADMVQALVSVGLLGTLIALLPRSAC